MWRLIVPMLLAVAGCGGGVGGAGSGDVEVASSTSTSTVETPLHCDAAGSPCEMEPEVERPLDFVPAGTAPPTTTVTVPPTTSTTVPADEPNDADRVREAFEIVVGQIRIWDPAFTIAELRLLEAGDGDGGVARGCGDAPFARGDAFYCAGDDSIYVDVSLLRGEARNTDAFVAAALMVLAHEAGHGWEDQRGYAPDSGSTVVNRELFADCFSGAVMAAVQGSVDDAMRAIYALGDYAFDSRSHHGTPDQRREAVGYGATNGHEACDAYLRLS